MYICIRINMQFTIYGTNIKTRDVAVALGNIGNVAKK